MKNVDGFVCISKNKYDSFINIFGKRVDKSLKQSYENIQTNGFVFYESIAEATEGKEDLEQRNDLTNIKLAKLKMDIAETEEDLEELVDKSGLVVITYTEMGEMLLGPCMEGMPTAYPLPGAYLIANGLVNYSRFSSAEWTAQEAHRQGQCKASIATFYLE